ncbi:DUF2569 domain-containing protein [Bacillus horti]|uniref:DUF2569 domain-containing protein n=2 Tax=Caldalkalibacillus horti TaxID=77523 RepID=A0ABT9VY99_9BACI|nr:hypothetical protein [Bacillus horti]
MNPDTNQSSRLDVQPQDIKKEFDKKTKQVSGLGGWLILPHLGLILTIILHTYNLLEYSLPALLPLTWEPLTTPGSPYYHPLWGPVLIYEAILTLAYILFAVVAIVQFYRKKAILPKLMIIFYAGSLLFSVVDIILVSQLPDMTITAEDQKEIGRLLGMCAIWIPYFIRSKRVKNTFVN